VGDVGRVIGLMVLEGSTNGKGNTVSAVAIVDGGWIGFDMEGMGWGGGREEKRWEGKERKGRKLRRRY
jgi:hypothetical protein